MLETNGKPGSAGKQSDPALRIGTLGEGKK